MSDQAGPSTPSISVSVSSPPRSRSRSRSPSPSRSTLPNLVTPAPIAPSEPSAPAPRPAAKTLPDSTPLALQTPSKPEGGGLDVSEFDPFATPVPGRARGTEAAQQSDDTAPVSISTSAPPATDQVSATIASSSSTPHQTIQGAGGDTADPAGSTGVTPARNAGRARREVQREKEDQEPAFNFSGFLKDLRTKSAEPIARYLKSFLSNFAKKPFTVNEQIKLIHDFLKFIAEKMDQYEPWKSQTPLEFEHAMEAMEKLVMNRLYNYTFTPQLVPSQPITTDDLERDAVFAQRVRLFGWVREKHLDVPEGEAAQGFLGFAEQELLKINHYKAPRDKMICILNSCKVIFGLIRHLSSAPEAASADAFVPILIFVVLRSNPDNMLSNVEYINRFRSPRRLQGEAGYYLSSLSGAIAFIETMDASSLSNITQEEFEDNVTRAIQELPPSPSSRVRRPLSTEEMSPFAPTSPGEEPARPLTFPTMDNTRRFFQRTGNLAQEAVSKPLNAIGKILEGMQQDEASDSGSEDGRERLARAGMLQDTGGTGSATSTPRRGHPQARGGHGYRPATPESPSRRFAQMEIERSTTPSVPLPDFADLQTTLDVSSDAYDQTRRANVQTLHQMFPDLDEEVAEAVLEGCGDDLGMAIDRLLEM